MKNRFWKLLTLMVFVVVLAACSNEEANTSSKDDDTISFAFLPNTQNNTFQTAMTETYKNLA